MKSGDFIAFFSEGLGLSLVTLPDTKDLQTQNNHHHLLLSFLYPKMKTKPHQQTHF